MKKLLAIALTAFALNAFASGPAPARIDCKKPANAKKIQCAKPPESKVQPKKPIAPPTKVKKAPAAVQKKAEEKKD